MPRITGAGPEHAARVEVDPYVPLRVTWMARGPGGTLWWRFSGPRAMLETGYDGETGEIRDVTLVLPGPIARVTDGPPAAASTERGVPRWDPAAWREPLADGVERINPNYLDEPRSPRTELGADHLRVRIGEADAAAARELVCGRVRFGLSPGDALLWICVTDLSDDERALLDEHAARSLAPPTQAPPASATGWRAWLRGRATG